MGLIATVEQAFLPAMTAFLRAFSGDAGTNAGMAVLKGRSTVGATGIGLVSVSVETPAPCCASECYIVMGRYFQMRRFSALALAFLVALSCAVASDKKKDPDEIGNRDVGKGVNFYSLEKEIALGKQLAQEVERQAKIVDDPVIAEYVNRVGQNLVRNSDAHVPFTIKVVDAEEINAFALPGGFFFVNTGVVLNADTEAELAGVMAHEIAHVAARHGTRQATRGQIKIGR